MLLDYISSPPATLIASLRNWQPETNPIFPETARSGIIFTKGKKVTSEESDCFRELVVRAL